MREHDACLDFIDSLPEEDMSQEWCATPCLELRTLSIFANDYTKTRLQLLILRQDRVGKTSITNIDHNTHKTGYKQSRLFSRFHQLAKISARCGVREKTLKLSNGERIEIPNAARTVIVSRLVELCHHYCHENGFDALGRSTLFSIFQVCVRYERFGDDGEKIEKQNVEVAGETQVS